MAEFDKSLAIKARKDFPIFNFNYKDRQEFIYLDHAATSQKPRQVIKALNTYYEKQNANVHRGAHKLSTIATEAFENARKKTAEFINASSTKEIIFTRNATEAINLVANSWGHIGLKEGDEILLTLMEHHSNIVPWQLIAKQKNCKVKYVNINASGQLDLEDLKEKISERTKLLSIVHISNTLGCCNPIEEVTSIAKKYGTLVLLDACQSLAHRKIDVKALEIDFLAGSSHKLCGPTGIGFLWAKENILEAMPPFLGGGEMINEVFLENSTWSDLPHKFEAGTPAIGEAIGMGTALTYLTSIGLNKIESYEKALTSYLFNKLSTIEGLNILGPSPKTQSIRGSLATFHVKGIHSNDIAELLDSKNIYIRSGHHCCQPLHRHYKINSTARASLSFTSTTEEIDSLTEELRSIVAFIKKYS